VNTAALILMFFAFISIISFALLLFRFKIKPNLLPILAVSFILANVCLLLNAYKIDYLTAVAQPIIIILGFWLIFKIRLMYSILMVLTVYLLNAFFEAFFNLIFQIMELSFETYEYLTIIPTLSLICNTTICLILLKFRLGFSFVASNHFFKTKLHGKNIIYLYSSCFLCLVLCGLSFLYMDLFMLIGHSVILLLFGALVRFSFRQEELH
jgi:hypothetical protein